MPLNSGQKKQIAEKISTVVEIIGSELSDRAVIAMVEILSGYNFHDIQAALNKCCIEVKGCLALKDIIDRLPSNKTLPTADELWGQIYDYCTDERKTFVLPQLAWQALESTNGGIYELVNSGDKTGGRMAFKAAYERVSRGFNGTVEYAFRLGTDLEEREKTILQAIEDGRLLRSEVQPLLPQLDYDGNGVITTVSGLIAAAESQAMLPNKGDEPWQLSAKGAKTLAMMKEKLNTKAI